MRFEIVLRTVNTRVSKVVADHDSLLFTMKINSAPIFFDTTNSDATKIISRK